MENMKKHLKWACVFLLLIMISLLIVFIHRQLSETAQTAQIIQDGRVIQTINLQNVKEPYEFEIAAHNGGNNIIRVENGKIGIVHANCPDKICVKQGFITNGALPIVCLPNKLSIVIINDNHELDAATGGIVK